MTEQSGGEAGRGAGIGARLRSARERSGLTVEQAAQKLHVAPAILESLEAEDFGPLGAPIYVKSYLGRYAELVGESPEALQQLLSSAVVIPEPDLTRIPHVKAESGRRFASATIVAVLVVAVVVVSSLWWGVSRWHERLALRAVPNEAASQPARPPAAGTPQQTVPAVPTVRQAATAARVASSHSVRITLTFSAPSWTEVDDAAGRHLYRALAPAATVRAVQGTAPLHVVLGYAPGVALRVNGRVTPITAFVQTDHTASLVITADGRVLSGPRAGGE